ncbi:Uncharacterised protein [uncultured archaeon]|nr:Uncharacterised protein [uncultured archaeon]
MGALEQITNMKRQGISDEEIYNNLSQQGISPREINDAMKQAQIKNAVSSSGEMEEGMQPSMMPEGEPPAPEDEGVYQPQQQYAPQQTYQPRTYEEQPQYAPSVQEEYQPQQYAPQESYAPSMGTDTDTIIEIADQIFSEKIKKFQNQIDASSESNALLQSRLENVSERLKKIETMIDKLQIAILEKVGSYGQNLESVKKEMSMMQDSFSKMVSPQRQTEIRKQPQENYAPQKENEFMPDEFKTLQKKISKK